MFAKCYQKASIEPDFFQSENTLSTMSVIGDRPMDDDVHTVKWFVWWCRFHLIKHLFDCLFVLFLTMVWMKIGAKPLRHHQWWWRQALPCHYIAGHNTWYPREYSVVDTNKSWSNIYTLKQTKSILTWKMCSRRWRQCRKFENSK